MDTDVQLHNGINTFSVIGDRRNIEALLETASRESARDGRPIQSIWSRDDTSIEGHIEINFAFVPQTDAEREAHRLLKGRA